MKATIKIKKEIELRTIHVDAGVRYWEDASVNGVEDKEGDLIPCRSGDRWSPIIEIDTGEILNWEDGKSAVIHYKVCDDGIYKVMDNDGNFHELDEDYVPDFLGIEDSGYGDYIIMNVDEKGIIQNWNIEPGDINIKTK